MRKSKFENNVSKNTHVAKKQFKKIDISRIFSFVKLKNIKIYNFGNMSNFQQYDIFKIVYITFSCQIMSFSKKKNK